MARREADGDRYSDEKGRERMMNMLTCNAHGMSPRGAPSYPMHSAYGYVGYNPDATQDGQ